MVGLYEAENMLKRAYLSAVAEALKEKEKPVKEKVICRGKTYVVPKEAKIGRNDLCPCGSGKKYKKCCVEKGGENE